MSSIDFTHDPQRQSWVETANEEGHPFPLQNLPFVVFELSGSHGRGGCGVAIGDSILDLSGLGRGWHEDLQWVEDATALNLLAAAGSGARKRIREGVSRGLEFGSEDRGRLEKHLYAAADCDLQMPFWVGDFTDFYASIDHATRIGSMFRPDNPLLPNYKWVPIGYHGRASSVVASGTPVPRPWGQTTPTEEGGEPGFGPCRQLDYELEFGVYVGAGNRIGETIPVGEAAERIFGYCLVNDWSARDIQRWEYQPLGPFLSKSFATTVSPYVVTPEALSPFRCAARVRGEGEPAPLGYLRDTGDLREGGLDVELEARLRSGAMREKGIDPLLICRSNTKYLYWTVNQMLTHHASNGCPMRPGDLLATGTVSGPGEEMRACLLEQTGRGQTPIVLPEGGERVFLADGDEIILTAWCKREGAVTIGFGSCAGIIESAS